MALFSRVLKAGICAAVGLTAAVALAAPGQNVLAKSPGPGIPPAQWGHAIAMPARHAGGAAVRKPTPVNHAPLSRDQTGALFGQTMGYVALTSGFFALGAYLARDMVGGWAWVFFIASFAALFGIQVAVQRSEQLAVGLLFASSGFALISIALVSTGYSPL